MNNRQEQISSDDIERVNGVWRKKIKVPTPLTATLTEASEDEVWEECRLRLEQHGFFPPQSEDDEPKRLPPKRLVHGFYMSTQQKRRTKMQEGLPDVFIGIAGVPIYFPCELKPRELKADGTLKNYRASYEQKELVKFGCNCIVRCAEDIDHIVNSLRRLFQHETTVSILQQTARVPSS